MINNALGAESAGVERLVLSPELLSRGFIVAENIAKKLEECNKTGHVKTSIIGYDFSNRTTQYYCKRCGNYCERPFTREESERFRRELSTPMDF